MLWYDTIYLLTALGLTSGGSSTVHIYTQTIHRTTQISSKSPQVLKRRICLSYVSALLLQYYLYFWTIILKRFHHHHHHHHELWCVSSCVYSLTLNVKLVTPLFPRSSCISPSLGLYHSARLGITLCPFSASVCNHVCRNSSIPRTICCTSCLS